MKFARVVPLLCVALFVAPAPRAHAQIKSGTRKRVVSPRTQALHDLLVKAKFEADGKNYAAAQSDYQKYLAENPDDAAAHFDLGYVFTAQHQTQKAIAEYRKAIALDPKMMQADLNLGMSLLAENPKQAIQPLKKAVQLDASSEPAHFALALAEERAGNNSAAQQQYELALQLAPADANARAGFARALLAGGKPAAAQRQFQKLLQLKPDDSQAELGLAQSFIAQKQNAQASQALAAYLKSNPGDVGEQITEASLLFQLGKTTEAISTLDAVAKIAPQNLDAWELRAQICYSQKNWPGAVAALQKAAKLAPNDARILAQLGHAFLKSRDYPRAAQQLLRSLQLDGSSSASTDALRDLVAAEFLGKNYSGTLAALDLLSRRQPSSAGTWYVRGSCYDHLNHPRAALDAYEKFLVMNTDKNSNQYFEAAARARFLKKLLKERSK